MEKGGCPVSFYLLSMQREFFEATSTTFKESMDINLQIEPYLEENYLLFTLVPLFLLWHDPYFVESLVFSSSIGN
jgi:hypothetical protein